MTVAEPRTLGIIPARGESKRLPRKNIRPLAGHPLIAYTIMAARKARRLTNYLVSSEDPEILEIARAYDAPTPFVRPRHFAGDEVRNVDTVRHALDFMEEKTGRLYDVVMLLQPTSPIRNPRHIDEAIERLWKSPLDTLASVKGPYKKRDPILKGIRNGVLEPFCGGGKDPSESEAFYLYNASIYAAKRDYFRREGKLISRCQVPLLMDAIHSIDVDEEVDFLVAETYIAYLASNPKAAKV